MRKLKYLVADALAKGCDTLVSIGGVQVGNIQLTRIMGGDVRMHPAGFGIGIRDSWQRALESVEAAGGTPYPIPAGASDHPLGGLGFAGWPREVAA